MQVSLLPLTQTSPKARIGHGAPHDGLPTGQPTGRRLTDADAVDIWIARWLRVRRKDLVKRYGCDPRRIYEVWSGDKFPGSRTKAQDIFLERHPELETRIDFGRHRIIPRKPDPDSQLTLFEVRPR